MAEEIVAAQIKAARQCYPQHAGKSDLFVVAMLASNRIHGARVNAETMKLNAWQAQRIAQLEAEVARLDAEMKATA